jgi:hypothetical protein
LRFPDNFRNINIQEIAFKKSKFTEAQFGFALRQPEEGVNVADPSKICGIIDTHNDVVGWPILKSSGSKR